MLCFKALAYLYYTCVNFCFNIIVHQASGNAAIVFLSQQYCCHNSITVWIFFTTHCLYYTIMHICGFSSINYRFIVAQPVIMLECKVSTRSRSWCQNCSIDITCSEDMRHHKCEGRQTNWRDNLIMFPCYGPDVFVKKTDTCTFLLLVSKKCPVVQVTKWHGRGQLYMRLQSTWHRCWLLMWNHKAHDTSGPGWF